MIKPKLRRDSIISGDYPGIDVRDITVNEISFCIPLEFIVGEADKEGGDLFQIEVCSPEWIEKELEMIHILSNRHLVIVKKWNFLTVIDFIETYLESCTAENWNDVTLKISRMAQWEFEDYH